MPDNNELYHYGVVGMKWGVLKYQNKDGSLTDAGRKRYGSEDDKGKGIFSSKSSRQAVKAKKERVKAKEKAAKEEAKQKLTDEQKAKLKEEIISKGDYRKALANVEMFSNQELQTLVDRRTKMNNLEAFKVREKSNIRKGAEKATEILNVIGNLGSASIKVYNNTASIRNLIKDGIEDETGKWRKAT